MSLALRFVRVAETTSGSSRFWASAGAAVRRMSGVMGDFMKRSPMACGEICCRA